MRASRFVATLFTVFTGGAALASEPCCSVVSLDVRAGLLSVQENASKRRFEVKVDNPVLLGRIRPGQPVDADFASGKASVQGITGKFAIVGAAPTVAATKPGAGVTPPAASPQLGKAGVTPVPTAKSPMTAQGPTPALPAAKAPPAAAPTPPAPTAAVTPPPASKAPTLTIPGHAQAPIGSGATLGSKPAETPAPTAAVTPPASKGPTLTIPGHSAPTSPMAGAGSKPTSPIPGSGPAAAGGALALGGGSPTRSGKTYTLPTMSVGEPVRATGKTRAQLPMVKTRHLRGLDEINDSSLAESAKIALMMHVGQLPENASNHYIVIPEMAEQWAKTHKVPDEMKPKKKKKKKKKCDWTHSGGCADKVKATVQDVWDSATEEWREQWKRNTKQLAEAWNEAQECFADHTLKLGDIPVRFDLPVSFPLSVERDAKKSGASGSASGNAKGTLDVGFPVQGDFRAEVEMFYIPCLPFAVRPKSLGADGTMTVTADLKARVQSNGKFDAEFMIPPSGGPAIPVAVLPIVIGGVPVAILDVSIYFDGSVRVGGEGALDGNVRLKAPYQSDFDFSCSGHGCRGNMKRVPMPATTTEEVVLKGSLYVQPAVYTALQLSLNFEALAGRAGPQPFLYGELRGCSAASGMQNTSGASTGQEFHALAFDLDWGVELRAEALVAGEQVEEYVKEVMKRRHIWFGDIAPGGSTAITPALSGPAQLGANSAGAFTLASRPCFPYGSPVEYQLAWAGGATAGVTPGKPAIGAGVMTKADGNANCSLGAGTGSCKLKPGTPATFNLAWPGPGTYTVTATPIRDEHGREFKAERAAQFSVNVQ